MVGDDQFLQHIARSREHRAKQLALSDLIAEVCGAYGIAERELASQARIRLHAEIRAEIARCAQEQGVATIKEVANRFNRTEAAICQGMTRLRLKERFDRQ